MKKLLLVAFLLVSILLVWCAKQDDQSGSSGYSTAQIDQLAQCLAEKNIIMYGTDRCPHCQNQKKKFGDAFEKITFIDCDDSRIQCQAAGVQGFPTWITPDWQKYAWGQSLESLATIGWCEL